MSEKVNSDESIRKLSIDNPIRRNACFNTTQDILELQEQIAQSLNEDEKKILNDRLREKVSSYNTLDCNSLKANDIYVQRRIKEERLLESSRGFRICVFTLLFILMFWIFLITFGYDTIYYITFGLDYYSVFSIIIFIMMLIIVAYIMSRGQRE